LPFYFAHDADYLFAAVSMPVIACLHAMPFAVSMPCLPAKSAAVRAQERCSSFYLLPCCHLPLFASPLRFERLMPPFDTHVTPGHFALRSCLPATMLIRHLLPPLR